MSDHTAILARLMAENVDLRLQVKDLDAEVKRAHERIEWIMQHFFGEVVTKESQTNG